jgi:hypothetical protein
MAPNTALTIAPLGRKAPANSRSFMEVRLWLVTSRDYVTVEAKAVVDVR